MTLKMNAETKIKPFDMADVAVLDGPFKHAMDINKKYLLELEPDRLLARFREYAGLEPKAPHYEGWEAMSLSGHTPRPLPIRMFYALYFNERIAF